MEWSKIEEIKLLYAVNFFGRHQISKISNFITTRTELEVIKKIYLIQKHIIKSKGLKTPFPNCTYYCNNISNISNNNNAKSMFCDVIFSKFFYNSYINNANTAQLYYLSLLNYLNNLLPLVISLYNERIRNNSKEEDEIIENDVIKAVDLLDSDQYFDYIHFQNYDPYEIMNLTKYILEKYSGMLNSLSVNNIVTHIDNLLSDFYINDSNIKNIKSLINKTIANTIITK